MNRVFLAFDALNHASEIFPGNLRIVASVWRVRAVAGTVAWSFFSRPSDRSGSSKGSFHRHCYSNYNDIHHDLDWRILDLPVLFTDIVGKLLTHVATSA